MKKEFITELEVTLKYTGVFAGKAISFTVAMPCSG
jgi:hypothetical protein